MRGLQLNNTKNNIQTVYLMIMFCILTKNYYQVIRAFKKHCLLGSYTILQKKSSLYNYLLRLILVFLFMYKKVPSPVEVWHFFMSYDTTTMV